MPVAMATGNFFNVSSWFRRFAADGRVIHFAGGNRCGHFDRVSPFLPAILSIDRVTNWNDDLQRAGVLFPSAETKETNDWLTGSFEWPTS